MKTVTITLGQIDNGYILSLEEWDAAGEEGQFFGGRPSKSARKFVATKDDAASNIIEFISTPTTVAPVTSVN